MKKAIAALLTFVFLLTMASCKGQNTDTAFYTNADSIFVDTCSSSCLSFSLLLLSNTKINSVEYIGLEGESIDWRNFDVTIIDNTLKEISKYKYKGMYIKVLMIEITPKTSSESITISSIKLNVDGTARKIDFKTPLKNVFSGGNNFTAYLQPAVLPNDFNISFINNKDALIIYEFNTTAPMELASIKCLDFLNISDLSIWVDGIQIQNAALPIHIESNKNVKIGLRYSSDNISKRSYLSTNIYFNLINSTDNKEYSNSIVLTFDPVYPVFSEDMSSIRGIIDEIIKEK